MNKINKQSDESLSELLLESKCVLTSKIIKKIYIKSNDTIEIKKGTGLSMTIESTNLINCKIENSVLYIETSKIKNSITHIFELFCCNYWNCCNYCYHSDDNIDRDEKIYNNTWTINSIFVVKHLNYSGSGTFIMNDGFDKSLTCIKSGTTGLILIKKLNVVNLKCKILGSGSIKTIESNCSNLYVEINGNGKIKTPKVNLLFDCTIKGRGIVTATVSEKCKIIKNISEKSICSINKIK